MSKQRGCVRRPPAGMPRRDLEDDESHVRLPNTSHPATFFFKA